MNELMSPPKGELANNVSVEGPPPDDLIEVCIYFYGDCKELRARVFSRDLYVYLII